MPLSAASRFLAMHGPMNTIAASGSRFFIMRAWATMGEGTGARYFNAPG